MVFLRSSFYDRIVDRPIAHPTFNDPRIQVEQIEDSLNAVVDAIIRCPGEYTTFSSIVGS
jgi:ABC-type sugar transport system substrate-binding protein